MKRTDPTMAGVDVGGDMKGFHAVALRKNRIVATLATCSAADVTSWCRAQEVVAVGIDAPCRWSFTGGARPCERELARLRMSCFSTPSRAIGEAHPFYRWMVNGAELFRLLASEYRLYDGRLPLIGHICFETFPQAIACRLARKTLSARHKRVDRRRLLENVGIATDTIATIDGIDATLCALTAHHVLAGTFNAYGDVSEGFILLPGR